MIDKADAAVQSGDAWHVLSLRRRGRRIAHRAFCAASNRATPVTVLPINAVIAAADRSPVAAAEIARPVWRRFVCGISPLGEKLCPRSSSQFGIALATCPI
jgi:hypothetical protein